ncbi:hypothetical protein BV924_18095 [Pectobacterium odoriferum]|uniref:DUF2157 domain-containing protein n=1 Tax=Pectobacterium odoriferum TaxID=78398 RepID=A0ABD6VN93_9GAMM|nr:hypothetical protein [Pectobacterium odoriferum]POD93048.1 hypothetical protein BVY06_18350 [Pectobacterium odoriferum]POE09975.1 hypothetical protein BV924_18095 [Pectobacterium odoriferum]POE24678.1 hypothetical protein BV926_18045 [Pectobacterium odoriferum]POE29407.1 hypothetical protein BV919_18065 [Pectobacterium odoriferum]POE38046.1 hypothetical protein BV920_18500 [Pectobacterium odoriferum]
MDAFMAWVNNPLVQSAVISPLIGAILGVLFAGLNKSPPPTAPATVQQTVIVFKQTIVVKQSRGSASSSNDGMALLGAAFIVTALVIWGYSRYAHDILYYWTSGAFSCTAFILAAGLASAIRGQYSSAEWVWYIFTPLIAMGASFYLIQLAQEGIITGAREATFRYGIIDYYWRVLNDEQRIWILCQLFGVALGIGATFAATLRSLHYLALMNQRTTGALSSLWFALARFTRFSAQASGVVLLIVLLGAAYFMLAGQVHELWMHRS